MNTPTFQEKIMTSFNLKKDKYPLSETQLSQHDSKKTKTPNNPTIGLFILTTTISPPSVKKLIWMIRGVMLFI
ncbi:Uncharacterised protein [Serratia fonticola]|nr:Uncharacterised protein [Serratia fonticola]